MPRDTPPLEPYPEYFLTPSQRLEMERAFLHAAVRLSAKQTGLSMTENEIQHFSETLQRCFGIEPGPSPRN